jgi:hypothetical protein
MKTLKMLVALSVVLGAAGQAQATFSTRVYTQSNGNSLFRRNFTINIGETLSFRTIGCSTSNADSVLYLIQGSIGTIGPRTLLKRSDDFGDTTVGSLCSRVDFANNTGGAVFVELLMISFSPFNTGQVTLQQMRSPATTWSSVTTQALGASRAFGNWPNNTTVMTVSQRPAANGTVDPVLYVMDSDGATGTARFDDDSGLRLNAKLFTNDCQFRSCEIITAGFPSVNGTVTTWLTVPGEDGDGDGIPGPIETQYSLLDNNKDTDNDGLTDDVELIGVPAASLSGGDSSLTMPDQDADPLVQDLYVEVDFMGDGTHSHQPYAALGTDFAAIFTNDTTFTGRTIRTHIEVSQNLGEFLAIDFAPCTVMNPPPGRASFYTFKNNTSFFDPLRTKVYHYAVQAHQRFNQDATCSLSGSSGVAEVWGNDVIVSLGSFTGQVGSTNQQRGTNTHELGHNLFLTHNGNDDNFGSSLYGCVHSSVMNYRWQFSGWGNSPNVLRSFGYSSGACLSGNASLPGQGGVGFCNNTPNTCTNRCVRSGQVTFKGQCPIATSGPNMGKHVSNGTCDCDLTEWTAPPAPGTGTINRLSLDFQKSGNVGNGAGGAALESEDVAADYLHGGARMSARHWNVANQKRAYLESLGLKAGRDFTVGAANGKIYSVE